jgi:hypothetical protein
MKYSRKGVAPLKRILEEYAIIEGRSIEGRVFLKPNFFAE